MHLLVSAIEVGVDDLLQVRYCPDATDTAPTLLDEVAVLAIDVRVMMPFLVLPSGVT